jgi:hypothetical protein
MATEVASMYATIGADTSDLQKGLKDTKAGLKDLDAQFESLGNEVKKAEDAQKEYARAQKEVDDQMRKNQAAALAGIGLLIATGKALLDITNETAAYNQQIREMAAATGMGVEETSRLIQLADDYKISSDEMQRAMQMAVKNGFQPGVKGLADLADKYKAIQDPTERAAMLSEIFGRNWAKIVPLMEQGGKAVKDQAAAIDDSLVATEANVKASRDFEIAVDNLNDRLMAEKYAIGNSLIPALTQLASTTATTFDIFNNAVGGAKGGALSQGSAQIQGMFLLAQAAEEGKIGLRDLALYSVLFNNTAGDQIKTLASLKSQIAANTAETGGYADATDYAAIGAYQLTSALGDLDKANYKAVNAEKAATHQRDSAIGPLENERQLTLELADAEREAASAAMTAANTERAADKRRLERLSILDQLKGAEQRLAEQMKDWSRTLGQDVAEGLQKAKLSAQQYRQALTLIDETLGTNLGQQQDYKDALANLIKTYDPNKPEEFKKALAGLKEAFAPMNDGIKETMQLIDDLEAQYQALQGRSVSMYVDVYLRDHTGQMGGGNSGGSGNAPGNHPPGKRAAGGPVTTGQEYMVGESGPELFVPNSSGKIIPNNRLTGSSNTFVQNFYDRSAAALGQAQIRRLRQSALNASMGG